MSQKVGQILQLQCRNRPQISSSQPFGLLFPLTYSFRTSSSLFQANCKYYKKKPIQIFNSQFLKMIFLVPLMGLFWYYRRDCSRRLRNADLDQGFWGVTNSANLVRLPTAGGHINVYEYWCSHDRQDRLHRKVRERE